MAAETADSFDLWKDTIADAISSRLVSITLSAERFANVYVSFECVCEATCSMKPRKVSASAASAQSISRRAQKHARSDQKAWCSSLGRLSGFVATVNCSIALLIA